MGIECTINTKNTYCMCKNGVKYRKHSAANGVTECCDMPSSFPLLTASYPDVKSYITAYVANQSGNPSPCLAFYSSLGTDAQIKEGHPELYDMFDDQRKLNNEFYASQPTLGSKSITCSTGVPYLIAYNDRKNQSHSTRYICKEGDFKEIDVEYSAYHIRSNTGSDCMSGVCHTKYDSEYGYNSGGVKFESSTKKDNDDVWRKWWFWLIIIIFAVLLTVAGFYIYHYQHNKLVSGYKQTLGKKGTRKVMRKEYLHEAGQY